MEPNTTQTRFFIGSITKQFTAALILILKDDHLLNLNDPISSYLTDYPKKVGDIVTIHQLLSHSSGIPNYTDNIAVLLRRTESMSPTELISIFEGEPLEFDPGTKFQYSNSNYILLGEIIERVSGQSYEAFLNRRILRPAEMHNTGYARREAGVPIRAEGYTIEDKEIPAEALPIDFSILHSAGALYSTVEDLYLWNKALQSGSILSPTSMDAMFTSYINGYGYGWMIGNLFGRRHFYHGGFLDGFNSIISFYPDEQVCIVICSNEDEAPVEKMAEGLAAILFKQPHPKPISKIPALIDPGEFAEYTGVYQSEDGIYRFVSLEHDTLFTHRRGQRRQTVFSEAVDTFFFASDNTKHLAFSRTDSGSVKGCTVSDGYRISKFRKLSGPQVELLTIDRKEINLSLEIMKRYVGYYEMESQYGRGGRDFVLEINIINNQISASITETETIILFPSSESDFFLKDGDFQISFILGENEEVLGCVLVMGGLTVHGIKIQ
jgi:CubicO group peptidase (beta-lactamase class C family)